MRNYGASARIIQESPPEPASVSITPILLFALALLALSLWIQFSCGDIGDKTWLLYATRKWMEGARLYRDIFESNPPLIFYIMRVPAYVALHSPLKDYHASVMFSFILAFLSISVSVRLLSYHPEFQCNACRKAQFTLLLILVLCFYANPAYFGDREYLFFILVVPYILRWMPSLLPERLPNGLRLITGIMAAIGFCIKPHCFVVFACIQILSILHRRSPAILFSLENWVIYGFALAYLASIRLWTPEYLFVVLPMALKTYSSYKANPVTQITFSFCMMAIPFADFRFGHASPWRRDIMYLTGICAACALYVAVNNGWGYTLLPLDNMILVLTGFLYWEYDWLRQDARANGAAEKPFLYGMRACLFSFAIAISGVLLITCIAFTAHCTRLEGCSSQNGFSKAIRQNNAHSYGTMTYDMALWITLARQGAASWQTRFNFLWMVPKLVTSDDAFLRRNSWITSYVSEAYAEDMTRHKPDIMFVDASPLVYLTSKHADLLKFFNDSAAFREAWRHYAFQGSIDFCTPRLRWLCRYDMYRRINEPKRQE